MKPPGFAIAIALILPTPASTAFAHSGGLNAEGCHTNRKTGDYHCHRGPKANGGSGRQSAFSGSIGAFRNCSEARAAGAAPVRRGDPGYGRHLDRDNDGIGCE
ncbi:MAG TPA: excalibur calcium-binding domain-containing protein [Woeseiaceae bacterium]